MGHKSLAVLLAFAFLGLRAAYASEQPSFDCSKAHFPIEHILCADRELARLDSDMGEAYTRARSGAGAEVRNRILGEQRGFLADRLRRCGIPAKGTVSIEQAVSAKPCLVTLYRTRIQELGLAATGTRITVEDILGSSETAERREILAEYRVDPTAGTLVTGHGRDVVVLLNETANATSVVRNLQGDVVFRTGDASFCRITSITADPSFRRYVMQKLSEDVPLDGAEYETSIRCTFEAETADLFVFERRQLEQVSAAALKQLLNAIRSQHLSVLEEISFEDFQRALQREQVQAEQVETEVLKGERKGYGFVALEHEGRSICSTEDVPLPVLTDLTETTPEPLNLNIHLEDLEPTKKDVEGAFIRAKTGDCRVIFGSGVALRELISGFRRDTVTYHVLPTWFSEQRVREEVSEFELTREEEIRRRERERIRSQEDDTLDRIRAEETGQLRAERLKVLRDRFSSNATRLLDKVTADLTNVVAGEATERSFQIDDASEWMRLSQWVQDRKVERWKFEPPSTEVVDYGLAEWKGRYIEAVVVRAEVEMSNRMLGERQKACFVLALLDDGEFDIQRQLQMIQCGVQAAGLHTWKVANGFQSRWYVGE